MVSIGPQIPAHLLKQSKTSHSDDDDDGPQPSASIGPQIPAHILNSSSKLQVIDDDDDDDGPHPAPGPNIGPTIPTVPTIATRPIVGPSMPPKSAARSIGPSLPNYAPTYDPNTAYDDEDSDDDDDVGPKPLPAGMQHQQSDAVQEFLEREEKRRKAAEVRIVCFLTKQPINLLSGSGETQSSAT